MAELNGELVILKVRENGSAAAFKQLVCTSSLEFNAANDVSTKKTSCGPKTAITDPVVTISGSGVYQTAPSGTQVSWEDIIGWQKNKTKLDYIFENDADASIPITEGGYIAYIGSGYFNDSTFTGSAEDGFSTFDFTFTGTGVINSYDV